MQNSPSWRARELTQGLGVQVNAEDLEVVTGRYVVAQGQDGARLEDESWVWTLLEIPGERISEFVLIWMRKTRCGAARTCVQSM